jgi:CheY-like chemotaxis protein
MKILFLDDDEARHYYFTKIYMDKISNNKELICEYKMVWDAKTCIEALEANPAFDLVYLDHDLGNKHYVDINLENTGSEVARHIANKLDKEKRPKAVIVHSWNIIGALNMEQLIKSVGILVIRQPFKV